jgi:hypothetical protein
MKEPRLKDDEFERPRQSLMLAGYDFERTSVCGPQGAC